MQIAARGIDAQRPAALARLFPGGQGQAVEKQSRDGFAGERRRFNAAFDQCTRISRTIGAWKFVERDYFTTGIAPERIGLCRPVEKTRAGCIGIEVMLGGVVVGEDFFQTGGHDSGL